MLEGEIQADEFDVLIEYFYHRNSRKLNDLGKQK